MEKRITAWIYTNNHSVDPTDWTPEEVNRLLTHLGYEQLIPSFTASGVSGRVLMTLPEEDIRLLATPLDQPRPNLGHAQMIRELIQALSQNYGPDRKDVILINRRYFWLILTQKNRNLLARNGIQFQVVTHQLGKTLLVAGVEATSVLLADLAELGQ